MASQSSKLKVGKLSLNFENLEVESSAEQTPLVIPLPDLAALAAGRLNANGTVKPALPTTDKPAAPSGERRPARRAGVK